MRTVSLALPLPADTSISWRAPEPRAGLAGLIDKTFGPGATRQELALFAAATTIALALLLAGRAVGIVGAHWSFLQTVTACFLALNAGFVVAIATSTCKRWYHRGEGVSGRSLALVLADGLFQLALTNAVFLRDDPRYAGILGAFFVLGGLLIPRVPLYTRRPVSYLLFFGGILLSSYAAPTIPGLEWFPIVFFTKYFVAHIPREEPYRATTAIEAHSAASDQRSARQTSLTSATPSATAS